MIEPGFIRTNLARNRQDAVNRISDYDPWRQRTYGAIHQYEEQAPEPTLVAECVLRVIESKSPSSRYKVGEDATILLARQSYPPNHI